MEGINVELFIPGELKERPIICDMVREFKIDMKILEASFSTESGWAYLIINGETSETDRLFSYLKDIGIETKIR